MPNNIPIIVNQAYKGAMESALKRSTPWTDREFLGEFCTQIRRLSRVAYESHRTISRTEYDRLKGMSMVGNWVRPGVPESWVAGREDFELPISVDIETPTQPTSGLVPVDPDRVSFLLMQDAISEVLKLSRKVEGLTSDGRTTVNGLKMAMDQLYPEKAA